MWAFIFKIFYQVWEELSFYESGLWKRLLTLFTKLTCRGRTQDSKRPCSFGTVTESTVFWGESGRIIEAIFPLDSVFMFSLLPEETRYIFFSRRFPLDKCLHLLASRLHLALMDKPSGSAVSKSPSLFSLVSVSSESVSVLCPGTLICQVLSLPC